jgi:hypothetical protein
MPNKSPKRSREKQTKTAQPAQIYELKIMLRGSKPPIWRRIAVAADMRLSDLHQVIQVVMGWGTTICTSLSSATVAGATSEWR